MSDDEEPLVISSGGDLILQVGQDENSPHFSYRVHSKILQQNSRYFENLLSSRFSEGRHLATVLEGLNLGPNSAIADVRAKDLPRISIINVGKIAISKASSLQKLVADILRTIHGVDIGAVPPVANLANLAVVADRFDAAACLSKYVQKKKYLQSTDAKSKGKGLNTLTEERARQKLLIGLLFDYPPWVTRYSKYIILKDSQQWQPDVAEDHTKALWWDIPYGVEGELIKRREFVLETLNSLQSHFLKLYTSGERQCKLGYDTSLQCDSFQLGEMVRFFSKSDTLRLQGKIYDDTEPTYYLGDIERLLASLRQCSNYQVDANHSHCGLRSRLLPLLEYIQNHLSLENGSQDVGICGECWKDHRSEYAWSQAKRPVSWALPRSLAANRTFAGNFLRNNHEQTPNICFNRHVTVRDLFMAAERDWTTRDSFSGTATDQSSFGTLR